MKSHFWLRVVILVSLALTWPAPALARPGETAASPQKPAAVESLATFSQVSPGGSHTCALTSGGGVKCWGTNNSGQLGDGTNLPRGTPVDVIGLTSGVSAIAAGGNHTCALMDEAHGRSVKCWGYNYFGQVGDNTGANSSTPVDVSGPITNVVAISAGDSHTCALFMNNGGLKCWGYNASGQIGDGTTTRRFAPVDVSGPITTAVAISAGGYHTCALISGGGVKCWGDNTDGQIGDGTTSRRTTPTNVPSLSTGVAAIAAGGYHTCALTTGGGVKCWGYNSSGQLGDGTATNRPTPVDATGLTSGAGAVTAGGYYTCALVSGAVKCWGNNIFGQLGDGTTTGRSTPVGVSGLAGGAAAVAAGWAHACALTTGGGIKCWGYNGGGQLGDATVAQRALPMDVSGLSAGLTAVAVATGTQYHTCAVTAVGGAKCWGDNRYGQVGDGTTIARSLPVDVSGLTSVTALALGGSYTCALTTGGGVKCWGANNVGQLGDGTITDRSTPVDVIGLSGVTAVTAGGSHTCVLTGGGVKCWGANGYGQLGDGTRIYRRAPAYVSGLTSGAAAVGAGNAHACALMDAGHGGGVTCWGQNNLGQLGDGTTVISSSVPVTVTALGGPAAALAVGPYHSCALMAGGGVKCWGYNTTGQLGDGGATAPYSRTPVDVIGLGGPVTAVAAGWYHTCALIAGGAVQCWGDNTYGQLGDGTFVSRLTPAPVSGLAGGALALAAGTYHTCALVTGGRLVCWGWDNYGQLGLGTTVQRSMPVDLVDSLPAVVTLNYPSGEPGSYFTLTGMNFPPSAPLTITVNSTVLTDTLTTNETGGFIVFLNTDSATEGYHVVTASVNPSASALFFLRPGLPERPLEGGGVSLGVPASLGLPINWVYLPLTRR